jgi:hypothetical protein
MVIEKCTSKIISVKSIIKNYLQTKESRVKYYTNKLYSFYYALNLIQHNIIYSGNASTQTMEYGF